MKTVLSEKTSQVPRMTHDDEDYRVKVIAYRYSVLVLHNPKLHSVSLYHDPFPDIRSIR